MMKQALLTALTALALLSLGLLAACDQGDGSAMPAGVEDRAQARWDALGEGDWKAAYQYLSPGYRSSVSEDTYRLRLLNQRVRWTGGEVTSSDCGETACTVNVAVTYEIARPFDGVNEMSSTRRTQESWVRSDGHWWYLPGE